MSRLYYPKSPKKKVRQLCEDYGGEGMKSVELYEIGQTIKLGIE